MKKSEFLSELSAILQKNQVEDAAEIMEEYEQHFAFKLADGYSEEEIAAGLGDPKQLAMQYERSSAENKPPLAEHRAGRTDGFCRLLHSRLYFLYTVCGKYFLLACVGLV